jgi:hypothetical protein
VIRFTYKLKLNKRVRASAVANPATTQRRTPLPDGLREYYFRIARHEGATKYLSMVVDVGIRFLI